MKTGRSRPFINPAVEPALGTAGTGDVLTGVMGALPAEGLAALDAAVAAPSLHGLAGTRARHPTALRA